MWARRGLRLPHLVGEPGQPADPGLSTSHEQRGAADAGEDPERIGVEHRIELSPQRRPEPPATIGPVRQAGELVASESIEPALRVVAIAGRGGTPLGEVLVGVVEAEIEGLLRWHDALVAMPAEERSVAD